MMAISEKSLTLEEFLQLPEKKPALEFEDGVVVRKPVPKGKHSRLQYAFSEFLNRFAVPRELACAFPELRATFGGHSYVPDVAVYRWERIPSDAMGQVADDFFDPPDLAIEIVSPKQSVTAMFRRCLWYVAHGVGIALLVDPSDYSVLLFRAGRVTEALRGTDQIDLAVLLPGFTLTVNDLYDSLRLKVSR